MLKLIFDKDVNFISKKIITLKGGDFKNGALHSDFMFVNIEPYKSKKCVPCEVVKILRRCHPSTFDMTISRLQDFKLIKLLTYMI